MPPDSFSVPTVIGIAVLVLALAGVLILYLRVRGQLAQARGQLAQNRQVQDHLTRESSAWSQRLLQAERKVQEHADQVRDARAQHDLVRAETDHLINKRIPALLSHLRAPHVIVPGMQNQALAGTDVDRQHRAVLDAVTRGIRDEAERIDESAQAVIRGAMSRVQSQALRAQDLLIGVQQRYSGDEHTALLREVLGLDMFNELIIRRMQVTGIACGATPACRVTTPTWWTWWWAPSRGWRTSSCASTARPTTCAAGSASPPAPPSRSCSSPPSCWPTRCTTPTARSR